MENAKQTAACAPVQPSQAEGTDSEAGRGLEPPVPEANPKSNQAETRREEKEGIAH